MHRREAQVDGRLSSTLRVHRDGFAGGLRVLLVLVVASSAAADTFTDIRYTDIVARLGAATPTGAGVVVGQVEAPENAGGSYAPNATLAEFSGKDFTLYSGTVAASGHATEVGRNLFGNTLSIAPGTTDIHCWNVNTYIGSSWLKVGGTTVPAFPPAGMRVMNHSWIGSFGLAANDNNGLRRIDFIANRDNLVLAVGVNNGAGSAGQPLVAYAYNTIAVGLANGNHSNSPTPAGIDGPGRRKPDIVAPGSFTSFSTPVVGAAAALLIDAADSDPATMGNPNAARALTVKTVLMAGTTHRAGWSNGAATSGAARGTTATPLDPLYGADLLNIDRAHMILTAGEQGGLPAAQQSFFAPARGWDYIPSVVAGSSVYWSFRVHEPIDELSATASWFRQVATTFASTTLQDLDLRLWKLENGVAMPLTGEAGVGVFTSGNVTSESTIDNVEHIHIRGLAAGDYALELARKPGTQIAMPVTVAWYMPETEAPPAIEGDLNGDGVVNASDLAILLGAWGTTGPGDLNGNGTVEAQDLATLLGNWS